MTLVVVVAMSSAGSKQPIPTILEDIPETPLLPCPPLFFRAIFWKNKREFRGCWFDFEKWPFSTIRSLLT